MADESLDAQCEKLLETLQRAGRPGPGRGKASASDVSACFSAISGASEAARLRALLRLSLWADEGALCELAEAALTEFATPATVDCFLLGALLPRCRLLAAAASRTLFKALEQLARRRPDDAVKLLAAATCSVSATVPRRLERVCLPARSQHFELVQRVAKAALSREQQGQLVARIVHRDAVFSPLQTTLEVLAALPRKEAAALEESGWRAEDADTRDEQFAETHFVRFLNALLLQVTSSSSLLPSFPLLMLSDSRPRCLPLPWTTSLLVSAT